MDNTKLAWLAGIIDGEGSMGMYRQTYHRKNHDIYFYRYQVTIANDDVNIIAGCLSIISEIIGRKAYVATAINHRTFVHHKVSVCPRNDVIKLLTAIEPYLVGKKAQAQVMLNVLIGHKPHSKYTRAELDVIEILKKMKDDNKIDAEDNAELKRQQSRKCVENIEIATQPQLMFK